MGGDYQEIPKSTLLLYYKRPEIQQAIASFTENKEVVGSFGGKGYAKRPDILQFPSDVFSQVQRGITSFHMSEETWSNPLLLAVGMRKQDLDALRNGWDLILDIDSPVLELSQLASDLIVQAVAYQGITSLSVKFSGNHGFHIAVPFESFPSSVYGKPTRELFPEGPKKIAAYLKEMVREHLSKKILAQFSIEKLKQQFAKTEDELSPQGIFDPFSVVDVDTVLISSRHLFRMPYSFNEKSGLVSIPIRPQDIASFNKESALPERVKVTIPFLDRAAALPGEAERLFVSAFDFEAPQRSALIARKEDQQEGQKKQVNFDELQEKIPEELFPPCIKKILGGIADGKKRSLFILVNFLHSCGWNYEDIEERLMKWSAACPEPLREVLIKGHVRYHKQQNKQVLPPNCDNPAYYKGMSFCMPDSFCAKINNPVSYARKKRFLTDQHKVKPKATKIDKNNKDVGADEQQKEKTTIEKIPKPEQSNEDQSDEEQSVDEHTD